MHNNHFLCFLCLLLLCPALLFAQAQSVKPDQWTITIFGGTAWSVSASMHGTIDEMVQQTILDVPQTTFPFGETQPEQEKTLYHIGISTTYRLPESPWGFYSSGGISTLGARGQSSVTSSTIAYQLSITSFAFGGEYTMGATSEALNGFWRLGLTVSLVSGYDDFNTRYEFGPALRGGLQTLVGLRYKFQGLPVGVEVSAGYTNVNLLGKSDGDRPTYRDRATGTGATRTSALNDGQTASGTGMRTIDFIAVSAGVFLHL